MSIKWRLATIVGAIATLLVVLGALVAQWRITTAIDQTAKDALRNTAKRVASDLSSPQSELPVARLARQVAASQEIQVTTRSGDLLYTTRAAGARLLMPTTTLQDVRSTLFLPAQPTTHGRIVLAMRAASHSNTVILVATSDDELGHALSELWIVVALAGTLAVVLSVGGAWLLARASLRPVANICAEAESLSLGTLAKRLAVPRTHDEIANLAEVINRFVDRLESMIESQNWFLHALSHELRTPLATVSAELQLAERRSSDPAALSEALGAAQLAAEQLATLYTDLLLFARYRAGSLTLELHEVDLEDLAASALVAAKDRCQDDALSFLLDCPAALSAVVDPTRLRQILDNLLENSIRYASVGIVTLSVRQEGDWIAITVKDQGEGLPENVFNRLARGESGESTDAGGMGFGLAIVKLLVELHHGVIEATNPAEGGACIGVRLPRVQEV
ncbi:HAMP domain-containing sensor histidine kinase [Ferrimicrobium acidiphilum]|uniref:histidine kinase n=1 Tax=Ferrimicrobium acidiphilum TaxID=121039 RepID=A0ABV3Y3W7_9ACTN